MVADEERDARSAEPPRSAPRRGARLRFVLALVLVALGAAGFAIAFRLALSAALGVATRATDVVSAMRAAPAWVRFALPSIGGLVAGLFGLLAARGEPGGGVSDVMEAVVIGRTRISMKTTLLKSMASWCAITTGGALGREGPLIQFGGAAGQLVAEKLGLRPRHVRVLIASGTAAGFAAAYNTPFAAILFVLEVVTGVVVLEAIVPVMIATVLATQLTRWALGEGPIYGARSFTLEGSIELFAFPLLGVVGALAAHGFMRLLAEGERWLRRPGLRLPLRPAVGGALAGAIIVFVPEVAGNGYEPLNAVLDGRYPLAFVAALVVAKCFATTASVSSGSPGGVFTPTLLLGGCIGFLFGEGVGWAFGVQVGSAGGYALVGMAATTAATTHAPLMAAVMAFELSGDYAIVLPLLFATAVATAISRVIGRDSIYTAELRERGIVWELTLEGRRIRRAP
jgi:CIC family chloride channel protein